MPVVFLFREHIMYFHCCIIIWEAKRVKRERVEVRKKRKEGRVERRGRIRQVEMRSLRADVYEHASNIHTAK